jgi:NSS family neurotransmitter:Na+ symporter
MSNQTNFFTSRFGLLMSALGVAVGTGNIWRFPRIAAQNGGESGAGALLIAWIILLFVWSIPLIIAEYAIGKKYRKGVVGSLGILLDRSKRWLAGFVAFVAAGISFFYAVIVGWAIYYFIHFLLNPLPETALQNQAVWDNFQSGYLPLIFHFLALAVGGVIILRGISSIERANKLLIPVLLSIILYAFIRILLLEGASDGIRYLFTPEWKQLADPRIWLQALTQNAWDTGAGWGLFLTYAAYMKYKHGTVKNAFITGIGNNAISLIMAVVIFGTVFSVLGFSQGLAHSEIISVMKTSGPASTGLTFIWIPQLFGTLEGGRILAILFFLGLSFAGFSSLVSMLELIAKILTDYGISRMNAVSMVIIIVFLLGVPSAININILSNQDFVWGLGLMVSGIIIAFALRKTNLAELINPVNEVQNDWKVPLVWKVIIRNVIPVLGIILTLWWMVLSVRVFAPESWYNPLNPFSLATVLVQWLVVCILLFFTFRVHKTQKKHP